MGKASPNIKKKHTWDYMGKKKKAHMNRRNVFGGEHLGRVPIWGHVRI
jgi:hypothetical protein